MLSAIRGQALNDQSFASGTEVKLMELDKTSLGDLPTKYDAEFLQSFFDSRPLASLSRVLVVGSALASTIAKYVASAVLGTKDDPDVQVANAAAFRDAITELGPFYIKLGQALSIRPDILPPRAMVEMQRLCDKVPSFDSGTAFGIIREELGIAEVGDVFEEITDEPVAAASLGQVYKAKLRGSGKQVAVKVQRPGVLETVSLDLYLARKLGSFLRLLPGASQLDVIGLLDEFAFRFYDELDYNLECDNGVKIRKQLEPLKDKVTIPEPFPEFTTRRVHTAEWCEGEKLSQSTAGDVGSLVNLGVIVYLTMLLDHGFFHADPHPGNMLRGDDGSLIILDFGLMTDVSTNARLGMVEAIVHLLNRDYDLIGQDFQNLEFIAPDVDTAPIVPALTKVFDAALAGGGAKSINFQEVAADLAEITFQFDFRLPPYFALIIRAISVLEGIALVGNPEFAIIDEAFPWIAKKLLTDDSPRLREALRYLVYGKEGVFDADRLIDVLVAFEKYARVKDEGDGTAFKVSGVRGGRDMGDAEGKKAGTRKVDISDRIVDGEAGRFATVSQRGGGGPNGRVMLSEAVNEGEAGGAEDKAVREALRFFFSPEGSFFRSFMLDEIASSADAVSREVLFILGRRFGIDPMTVPMVGGFSVLPGAGLLASFSPPLTEKDRKNLEEITKLLSFLSGRGAAGDLRSTATQLAPVVSEFRVEVRDFVVQVLMRLTEKRISRGLKFLQGGLLSS